MLRGSIVVTVLESHPETGRYLDSWSEEYQETGIRIAHSFQFTQPLSSP
jgi:hypothetical protein